MRSLRQFLLLVWKGLLLRKRHFIITAFEFILPLFATCIFVYIRTLIGHIPDQKIGESVWRPAQYFEPFDPLGEVNGEYRLYYAPNNSWSSRLVAKVQEKFESRVKFEVIPAVDEEHLEILLYNYSVPADYKNPVAIVLNNFNDIKTDTFPPSLDYKLRLNGYFDTASKYPFPPYSGNDGCCGQRRYNTFYAYQEAIDKSFIELKMEEKHISDKVLPKLMHKFPFPSYKKQDQSNILSVFTAIPYVILYSYLLTLLIFVKRIVDEKANRAKEMMKMIGLSDVVYWSGTFTNNFLLMLPVGIATAVLYKIRFVNGVAVIDNSDGFLFFVVLVLYTASAVLFCMTITTFFNRPVLAVIATFLLWVLSHDLIAPFLDPFGDSRKYSELSLSVKLVTCLLPNMALHWACKIMGFHEASGVGAQWFNVNTTAYVEDGFTLSMVMGMFVVSCAVFGFIIWYVDNVWPFQYGVPLPPYYPFTRSYWRSKFGKKPEYEEEEEIELPSKYFEEGMPSGKPGVILSHLTKEYGWGRSKKTAVNDVSMKIYSGEITALLGHNGAGKTTTMHMITGLFPPTSGTAYIYGCDIRFETRAARSSLGLCPQHNVLYDTLTAEEHLKFFAGLKGVPFNLISEEVRKTLDFLQLLPKRDELAKNLSGGMKRKLSLGMAMIGGSQVLILDEPTSGMDPQARRAVWDMLHELRKDKTILLTTHYMEEADVLGDRIAIMAEGFVQCYGSPLFLKKKFGAGYHLRLVKSQGFDLNNVIQMIEKHIPDVQVDNEINTEITLLLNASGSEQFVRLFDDLEKDKSKLGIASCGLSITTMEDVFLKVGQLAEQGLLEKSEATENGALIKNDDEDDLFMTVPRKLEGLMLHFQIMKGLILKRIHDSKRYIAFYVFQMILPFVVVCVLVSVDQYFVSNSVEHIQPLKLSIANVYGSSTIGLYTRGDTTETDKIMDVYKNILQTASVNPKEVDNTSSYIMDVGTENLIAYTQDYLVGASVTANDPIALETWFNGEPLHAGPMSLNLMNTALLNYMTNSEGSTISVTNSPFIYRTSSYSPGGGIYSDLSSLLIYSCLIPIALTFLSSSYVLFPIHERVSKSKLLQLMTGLSRVVFWAAHFAWDYLSYCICCTLLIIPFAALDRYGIFSGSSIGFGAIYSLLLLYGWSAIPLSYLVSFIPKTPAGGFTVITIFNIVAGIMSCMIMTSLRYIPANGISTAIWFLRLIPIYSITWGIGNVRSIAGKNSECVRIPLRKLQVLCPTATPDAPIFKCCADVCGDQCLKIRSYLSWDYDAAGRDAFCMFLMGCCFFGLIFLLETNFVKLWYNLKKKHNTVNAFDPVPMPDFSVEDSDVAAERSRIEEVVQRGDIGSEALVVTDLSKRFNNMHAVDHLTFSIHKKECFGFLGINGAGKTTTFSMLTGDLMIDEGNAFIQSHNVKDNLHEFQTYIGYCPQFDALLDRLTGRESLCFFARLRGIPEEDIPISVSKLIRMVDLEAHADKISAKYSGGNRRKLSLAMALIGAPPVVFLDEPTAGVDPAARRKIWEALMSAQRTGVMSFVLTTHSMAECEALCSRLAIMVNGRFQCLGATQYLKSKFGEGYTVTIKLPQAFSDDQQAITAIRLYVETKFPMSSLKGIYQGTLTYHILDNSILWSELFQAMETAKQHYSLEDYIVSDTTLEQIFLTFARNQRIVTV